MADNRVRFVATLEDKVSKGLTLVSKRFKDTNTQASLLGNIGANAVSKGFGLVDRALSGVVDLLGDAVQAGLEEEASVAKLNTALKANVAGWDGNTAAIERVLGARMKLGFSDDEQRDSLARLVAATHDVNKALDIQRTAMDLARFKGISLADAGDALIKVEAGQFRILKTLGIQLPKNATQTEALAAVQKVAAGQAESYARINTGKLLVSQVKVGEAMETLGTRIMPLVADAMGTMADAAGPVVDGVLAIVDAVKDANDWVEQHTGKAKDAAHYDDLWGDTSKGLGKTLKDLSTSIHDVVASELETLGVTDRTTDALSYMASATKDDMVVYADAVGTGEQANKDMGDSADDAATKVGDMVDSALADAKALVDGYYEPIEKKQQIQKNNADIVAAERILKSKEATTAEKRDARDAITQAMHDNDTMRLELLATGNLNDKQTKGFIADLRERLKTATGRERAYIQAVIDKIRQLDGMTAYINFVNKIRTEGVGAAVHEGGRAAGGPVSPYRAYTVGEHGPETLVMGAQGGTIIPNGGGGTINVVYSPQVSTASPNEARTFVRAIIPELRRELSRQGLV